MWDAEGQGSASHKAEDRVGDLSELSFSTVLGGVAFLVFLGLSTRYRKHFFIEVIG